MKWLTNDKTLSIQDTCTMYNFEPLSTSKDYIQQNTNIIEIPVEQGYVVLRLTPYYCIFYEIDFLWHELKSRVHSKNTSNLIRTVINLTTEKIENIPEYHWKNLRSKNHILIWRCPLWSSINQFMILICIDCSEWINNKHSYIPIYITSIFLLINKKLCHSIF